MPNLNETMNELKEIIVKEEKVKGYEKFNKHHTSPVTFIAGKVGSFDEVNTMFLDPWSSKSCIDMMSLAKLGQQNNNVTTLDEANMLSNDFNNIYRSSSDVMYQTIRDYLEMNIKDVTNSILLAFCRDAFKTESEECPFIAYSFIDVKEIDEVIRFALNGGACPSESTVDNAFRNNDGRNVYLCLENCMSFVFSELINKVFDRVIINGIMRFAKDGILVDFYKMLFELTYEAKPSHIPNDADTYVFCTSILRDICQNNYLLMLRGALTGIARNATMLFLQDSSNYLYKINDDIHDKRRELIKIEHPELDGDDLDKELRKGTFFYRRY